MIKSQTNRPQAKRRHRTHPPSAKRLSGRQLSNDDAIQLIHVIPPNQPTPTIDLEEGYTSHQYTKKDYLKMFRVIRLSKNSSYFNRLLINEIKKKQSNSPTILNTSAFDTEAIRNQLNCAWNNYLRKFYSQKRSTSKKNNTSTDGEGEESVASSDSLEVFEVVENDNSAPVGTTISNAQEVPAKQPQSDIETSVINDLYMQQSTSSGYTGLSPNFYPFRPVTNNHDSDSD